MKKKASAIVGSVLLIVSVWLLHLPNAPSTLLAQYSWTTSIKVYKDITVVHTDVRTIKNNETIAIDVKVYVTNTSEIHLLEYYALSANGTDFVIISGGVVIQSENTYYGLQPGQKLSFAVKAKPADSIKVGDTITVEIKVELWVEFLILTVATSKQFYYPEENIDLYGTLNLDVSPVDGLVALEVKDPKERSIVFRTLQTGTNPPVGDVSIIDFYPSDILGNPKNSFKRGSSNKVYFNVTVKNSNIIQRDVMITVNVYDGDTFPFGVAAIELSLLPSTSVWFISGILIPEWASIGTASAYASAFTGYPSLSGIAYCPEESATFEITGSTAALGTYEPNNSPGVKIQTGSMGSYSLTFKLVSEEEWIVDRRMRIGTYNVYVSSSYQEKYDKDHTTFEIKVPGDVDGDRDVDIYDLTKLALSWLKEIGDPKYNPNADFNGDGIVNIYDLTTMALNWFKW